MKLIPLTQGKLAVVSDDDFDFLSQWRWKYLRRDGYAYRTLVTGRINGKRTATTIYLHRVVLGRMGRADDGPICDHKNGDRLDNQRHNLRPATHSQNHMNAKLQANNTSGVKGVWYDAGRRKYEAYIKVDRRRRHLGRFDTIEEASAARLAAAARLHGEFARAV